MVAVQELSEYDLLCQSRAGDSAAFTSLYSKHSGPIYRFALHMSGNTAIAEEVLQETFLALLRETIHFDPSRGTMGSYLYGIARNRVRKHVSMGREFDETSEEAVDPGDVLGDLTRRQAIDSVRQAVLALPGAYREVVVLCELQELSYEQAADVLGCPVGTVRSRLHRARALLLEKLRVMKTNGSLS